MIRKGYVIIALAIVSVLVGSLFYNNITQAQKLHTFKDSVNISLFNVGSSGWNGQGVYFGGTHKIPFALNPREPFQNVTNLWFSLIYWTGASPVTIEISLNSIYITAKSLSATSRLRYVAFQATDTSVYSALTSGINELTLTSTDVLYLQEFTAFIEYEYQAR